MYFVALTDFKKISRSRYEADIKFGKLTAIVTSFIAI